MRPDLARGSGRSALAAGAPPSQAQLEEESAMTLSTSHETTAPFVGDIVALAKQNPYFREVVSTGPHAQVVVMTIPPGGEIGEEVHDDVDQVLVVIDGEGFAVLGGRRSMLSPGRLVHVPAGTRHNVVNEGPVDLKLYTVYTAPKHAPGTIHRTKAEADSEEAAD
jgi:mannose-6-phosphate isomerase-like protein (cupin superfamily)